MSDITIFVMGNMLIVSKHFWLKAGSVVAVIRRPKELRDVYELTPCVINEVSMGANGKMEAAFFQTDETLLVGPEHLFPETLIAIGVS